MQYIRPLITYLFLLSALCSCFNSDRVVTSEPKSSVSSTGHKISLSPGDEVVTAVTKDFYPFYYKTADGYKGASVEVVEELFHRLGYTLTFVEAPMKRLLKGLGSGEFHIAPNLTGTPSRRLVANFTSIPHVYESHDLIVLKESKIEFDGNLEALKDYSICAISGWTHGPGFDDADYLNKKYRLTVIQQLQSLVAGRFDMAVNNREHILFLAKNHKIENKIKVLSPSIFELPVTMAISKRLKNSSELVEQLDRELIQFKKEQKYKDIMQFYGFRSE